MLRLLQTRGPLSRAEVARESGLSAPTVSKAVASLLKAGLLEEADAELARGRPAPKLRLATTSAQVLGIAIDAGHCEVIAAGLDGAAHGDMLIVPTPASYPELLAALERAAREMMAKPGVNTLGLGVSLPGLVDYRQGRGVLSPNVPMTNGHAPAADLAARLGLECVLLQESHALCLAERHYGLAPRAGRLRGPRRGHGRRPRGDDGRAVAQGPLGTGGRDRTHYRGGRTAGGSCGCGNIGCLETVASDSALAYHAGRKLGRAVQRGRGDRPRALRVRSICRRNCDEIARYLAVGVAAVINLFNPAVVFIHSPLFDIDPALLGRVVERAGQRALPPSFAECRIVRAERKQASGCGRGYHPALDGRSGART